MGFLWVVAAALLLQVQLTVTAKSKRDKGLYCSGEWVG